MSRIVEDLNNSPHHKHDANTDGSPDSMHRLVLPQRRLLSAGDIPHVCVVGAGMAGLRCADVLIKSGVKVTLFEARDRIGGRVHQVETTTAAGGRLVDLGPNWIHGTERNPILDVARQAKTVLHEWDGRQACFGSKGERMSDGEATRLSEGVWEVIVEAFKYSDGHSGSIAAEESLMDFFKREIPKREKDLGRVAEIF